MGLRSFAKGIANSWWAFVAVLVIIAFFMQAFMVGILFIFVGVGMGIAVFLFKRRTRTSLSKNLIGLDKVNERELARLSGKYIEDAHAFLHDVSRNPDSAGIAILVKGEYIYFSNDVVKRFKAAYKEGKNTKELLADLEEFETRDEVKKMIEKLKEFDELPEREKTGAFA